MIFFGKTISKVYILSIFPDTVILDSMESFFQASGLEVKSYHPRSNDEFFSISEIKSDNLSDGILIQIMGHGGSDQKIAFTDGEGQIVIYYQELIKPLKEINAKCDSGLLLDMSIMCYSEGMLSLIKVNPGIIYAGLFSSGSQSLQTVLQTQQIYLKGKAPNNTIQLLESENNALEDSNTEGFRPFIYQPPIS